MSIANLAMINSTFDILLKIVCHLIVRSIEYVDVTCSSIIAVNASTLAAIPLVYLSATGVPGVDAVNQIKLLLLTQSLDFSQEMIT